MFYRMKKGYERQERESDFLERANMESDLTRIRHNPRLKREFVALAREIKGDNLLYLGSFLWIATHPIRGAYLVSNLIKIDKSRHEEDSDLEARGL